MNNSSIPSHSLAKPLTHKEILQELSGLLTGRWITDLANTSALLFQHFTDINWVGFYLAEDLKSSDSQILWLGPFQGLPACTMIPFAKGVCGTAAQTQTSQLVEDVDQFPGHIACDSRSKSEVVVPIVMNKKVIGVLDVDSASKARFDKNDLLFFEQVVETLIKANFSKKNEAGF